MCKKNLLKAFFVQLCGFKWRKRGDIVERGNSKLGIRIYKILEFKKCGITCKG